MMSGPTWNVFRISSANFGATLSISPCYAAFDWSLPEHNESVFLTFLKTTSFAIWAPKTVGSAPLFQKTINAQAKSDQQADSRSR